MMLLGSGGALAATTPTAGAASPVVAVGADACRSIDPNLVSGVCVRYQSGAHPAYSWMGTYRASDGSIFFCIDYLYNSRLDASAVRLSTTGLINQFGAPVGADEVAALNYLIGVRAPSGSTGSPIGDAAIALIIREVMSDGIRGDGLVVYPPGLKIYGAVQSLPGGMPPEILGLAQDWWVDASHFRGPWRVALEATSGSAISVGSVASYKVRVLTPEGHMAAAAPVRFTCSGAVTCPEPIISAFDPVTVSLTAKDLGPYEIAAKVEGPSGDGQLLVSGWSPHPGSQARDNGFQRGWIAQRVPAEVSARGTAEVVTAAPAIVTKAQPTAIVGDALTDEVTVSGVPEGYDQPMTARLYGPFTEQPDAESCTAETLVGEVDVRITKNETLRTPSIAVTKGGYYTWTESLPESEGASGVATPCGLVEETTRVIDRPQLRTAVSDTRMVTPGEVFDTITVAGVDRGEIEIEWTLLGPVLPGDHGCADVNWSKAPVRATGRVRSGTGTVRADPVKIALAGCYTYREHSDATDLVAEADSPAGLPEETFLATPPPLTVVPEVPTGFSNSSRLGSSRSGSSRLRWLDAAAAWVA